MNDSTYNGPMEGHSEPKPVECPECGHLGGAHNDPHNRNCVGVE